MLRGAVATATDLVGELWSDPELAQTSRDVLTRARNLAIRTFYENVGKPVFFFQDPEDVHDRMTRLGMALGEFAPTRWLTHKAFHYSHPSLRQSVLGIDFENPVGLSAGFDKDALLLGILPAVGFGFAEVGSITGKPCAGNSKPRLWRLENSEAIVVYYGLKNDGCEVIAARLAEQSCPIPVGISIAKTNSPDTVPLQAGIDDYVKAYRALSHVGSYDTINISCPNAFGGEPFTDPERLDRLLEAIGEVRNDKPMFIKLSPDLTDEVRQSLVDVSEKYGVDGYVCTNLTKSRDRPEIRDPTPGVGGISGRVVEAAATEAVRQVYQQTGGNKPIIGVGGVASAEGAYRKIRAGSSLIQMITGMIFQGPQVISEINQGLAQLLRRDGFTNIREAVGVDSATS